MTELELKTNVSKKITHYRKSCNMTQAELAARINYSDKSVSKWERGEGLPDLLVLMQLSELFGVTLNDLTSSGKPARPVQKIKERVLIPLLAVGVVWLVAVCLVFLCKLLFPEIQRLWLIYIYAIPVSCIVLVVFLKMWWKLWHRFFSVSALIWSLATCVFLTVQIEHMYLIFVVAAVLQILTILLYLLKYNPKKKK